jgi:hypothetical protein
MKNELSIVKKRRQDILADGLAALELTNRMATFRAHERGTRDLVLEYVAEQLAMSLGFASRIAAVELYDMPEAPSDLAQT